LYQIGWFSSGRDRAARDLLTAIHSAIQDGYIKDAAIRYLFINREYGESPESDALIDLAKAYGIEIVFSSHARFKPADRQKGLAESCTLGCESPTLRMWRESYDREIMERLQKIPVDLNVLAGYMLILSKLTVQAYRIINIHPAPPGGPAGSWQQVIWALITERAHNAGCMMHLVAEILDKGPPVTFCTFPIRGPAFDTLWSDLDARLRTTSMRDIMENEYETNPLFKAIRQEEAAREIPLLIETVKMFAEGKLAIRDRVVYAYGRRILGGLPLSDAVERHLKGSK